MERATQGSGFAREVVDDFLAAVARERGRLEAEIAAAEERERRARAAIGMHRVAASLILAAQGEISEIRAGAEAQAAEIRDAARREPGIRWAAVPKDDTRATDHEREWREAGFVRLAGSSARHEDGDDAFLAFLRGDGGRAARGRLHR